MKKLKILSAVVTVVCSMFITASAYAVSDTVISLQIDNPVMEINGAEFEIDEGRGTAPVIKDGRTLVPIRAIIEAFGGTVGWEQSTQSVLLTMDDDTIILTIDSKTAYLNDTIQTLDVAPAIINERTMLPLRFVAEGFNLGVAWDSEERTVSVIQNTFTETEYEMLLDVIPAYSGEAYVEINNNTPMFKDYEIISGSFEYYSKLDSLGRCDVCIASVSEDIMPTEDRESISSVTPTGWVNKSYDTVDGGYLYNRCHLIGFQLTGENANDRNLMTGTRYLNIDGMLPFENMVDDYIEETKNRVMYRVTPVFTGNNLVANGVLIEAYSVEDMGQGISFCVYCYNVQPGISIDYSTGENSLNGSTSDENQTGTQNSEDSNNEGTGVYRTPTGKKYHFDTDCGGKNSYEITMDEALGVGLTPCEKCVS